MVRPRHPVETLTAREREVLRLLAEGKTNPQVAEALGIRFETAKWYVSEVISKLGVSSREEAATEWRRYHALTARLQRLIAALPGGRVAKVALAAGAAVLTMVAFAIAFLLLRDSETGAPARPVIRAAFAVGPSFLEPQQIVVLEGPLYEQHPVGRMGRYSLLSWSPDGNMLAAIQLAESGAPLLHLLDPEEATDDLVRFGDGNSGAIEVEAVAAGEVAALDGFAVLLHSWAWSPNSEWLAVVESSRVILWRPGERSTLAFPNPAKPGGASGTSGRARPTWNLASTRLALFLNEKVLVRSIDGQSWDLDPASDLGPAQYGVPTWLDDSTLAISRYIDVEESFAVDLDDPFPAWHEVPGQPLAWPHPADQLRVREFAGSEEQYTILPTAGGRAWAYYFYEFGEEGDELLAVVVDHAGTLESLPVPESVVATTPSRPPADVVVIP